MENIDAEETSFMNGMRYLLAIFFLPFGVHLTSAQTGRLNFINFSSQHGLSSNTVNAIIKDSYGYMWFGTDDGLNRFDGVNFKIFRYAAGDSTSIGSNTITAICEDKNGNLWIGTTQTLSFFDRKKGSFLNYYFKGKSSVRSLLIDHNGSLWVGTYTGLFLYDRQTAPLNARSIDPVRVENITTKTILSIFEDSRQRLWIGTDIGLFQYHWKNKKFNLSRYGTDSLNPQKNTIRSITEDNSGNMWIGTLSGIVKLTPESKLSQIYRSGEGKETLSSDRVYTIVPDKFKRVWIGTEEGLNLLDLPSNKIQRVLGQSDEDKVSLSPNRYIKSIFVDTSDILWFGTQLGGVNKLDPNLPFFNIKRNMEFDVVSNKYPAVSSFVEGREGEIYVGTDGGGLHVFNRTLETIARVKFRIITDDEIRSITSMEQAGNAIWIGTQHNGIYVFDRLSGKVAHYFQGPDANNLSSNDIMCIKRIKNGNIWIGTNGGGVNVFDTEKKRFLKFDKTSAEKEFRIPLNGYIRSIEEDEQGNIWIGSQGSGLVIYDPVRKRFSHLTTDSSGLASNYIQCIYKSRQGQVWVGTAGNGLNVFDTRTKRFRLYSEADGLSNNVIYKILEDSRGRLWLSSNRGISCFDLASSRFSNYFYQNGVQRGGFVLGAGLCCRNGEMFFGGMEGFNFFYPKFLAINRVIPPLQFTDLRVSNQKIQPGHSGIIDEDITTAQQVKLEYKQNFSIEYSALNFTSPQDNRYSYKLDGFDKKWIEVGTSSTAVYTNLDPGEYKFRVKAHSVDGLWLTQERSIRIVVRTPFWRTMYAYIFYLSLIISGLLYLRYRGIRRIKKDFVTEQEKERIKQVLIRERKEVEQLREFDQMKIKFLTNLSHELRTPVSLIIDPIQRIISTESDVRKADQLNLVYRNAKRLLNLVNQLLDFHSPEENEIKLNLNVADLVPLIKEVADSFKLEADRKQIQFFFKSNIIQFYTAFDIDKIERTLFNLLSNAFKFTENGGTITIELIRLDIGINIKVSDTGIGIDPQIMAKVFDRFFKADSEKRATIPGTGIGLSIAKEFIKLHGGEISVESEPNKGSIFSINLHCPEIENAVGISNGKVGSKELKENLSFTLPVAASDQSAILIIDDNIDFRSYVSEELRREYIVLEASDGQEGWQKILSSHPKVIISDINMPGMDGTALSLKLKSDKRTSHIPIILLTGLNNNADHLRGLKTGANDYLIKPVDLDILRFKIRNLISLNQTFQDTYTRQLRVVPGMTIESPDENLLTKVINYIERNIDSPDLTVEDLSKQLYMSRGSLYSKILILTGETPIEFIRTIKLKKAKLLLEKSELKIAEIGYAVGYSSPNYFARAFKAKYNISPSEYLNQTRRPSPDKDVA
ncbi:MAG: response regulator [Sphingobacteriales bacterium]|nr:response regulator [Sphingobacteriales bacterium]